MIDYGIMPDCDLEYVGMTEGEEDHNVCPLPLGEIYVNFYQRGRGSMNGQIYIQFLQEPFESCLAFFNSGIYKNVPEDWWGLLCDSCTGGWIGVFNDNVGWKYVYGKSDWAIEEGAKTELSNTDILEACEICKTGNYCGVEWVIRNEY